jgi:serine/threonine protein kinase
MEPATGDTRTCPRCGTRLSPAAPDGLCAACLLSAGMESLTRSSIDDAPTMSTGTGAGPAVADEAKLSPGDIWGAYRIGRLLGRGGMGEVYEAEHNVTGRRLALKLLRRQLHDVEDRARFLREGQLAASVSHPHTVYIFGSEEIAGLPAISMELLPGGTLKDRVVARGPMPPSEAVSAVLDIIGGLDAAQAAGILHRDIKPSNCFIDAEGAVKVGDFGLSISTLARDARTDATPEGFEGTPQFAAPEQLRGEPLDVRADIYAVGATLYFLLTGRPPFVDARGLRELVERVTSEPPQSPRRLQPSIPMGLAAVVLRCLEKSPDRRPASYAALADALRPYSARDVRPAPPGLRLMAYVIDAVVMTLIISAWKVSRIDITYDSGAVDSLSWDWVLSLAYFLGLEGTFGTTIGKRLLGLRLSSMGAGWWPRVLVRTGVYWLPRMIVTLGVLIFGPIPVPNPSRLGANVTVNVHDTRELFASLIALALIVVIFTTARRRNGWAGVHDLLSGMRVVARTAAATRRTSASASAGDQDEGAPGRGGRIGPFTVLPGPAEQGKDDLVVGFDPLLRRKVWIRLVPSGTPPIGAQRRDVSRIGRLHWLTGRRSGDENWDAFEAPAGEPLLAPRSQPVDWSTRKPWLVDLATELQVATQDGSLPDLGLDRLWLRADGHLALLDFPAPGIGAAAVGQSGMNGLTPIGLLAEVSRFASAPSPGAQAPTMLMPLSARMLLDRLDAPAAPTLDEATSALATLGSTPDRPSRLRRSIPIMLASAPAVLMAAASLILLPILARFVASQNNELLEWLELLHRTPAADSRLADPSVRDAVETYVAGRFGAALRDESFWRSRMMQSSSLSKYRPVATGLLERHPVVTPDQLSRAGEQIGPELARSKQLRARRANNSLGQAGVVIGTALVLLGLAVVFVCSLISSLAVPGGAVTRMLGLAVVTARGKEIGRMRSVARTLVAWLPALAWFAYLAFSPKIQGWVPAPKWPITSAALTFGLLFVGVFWTIARPSRGPHDWLMRTWVVPR